MDLRNYFQPTEVNDDEPPSKRPKESEHLAAVQLLVVAQKSHCFQKRVAEGKAALIMVCRWSRNVL